MLYQLPGLIQTAYVDLTSNVSTTSTTYVDLPGLTLTITTGYSFLVVDFACCVEIVSALGDIGCQLLIDGSVVAGTKGRIAASGSPGYTSCPTIRYKTTLRVSEGSHTIKIQWKTSASTVQIRPANFIYGSGSLLVREMSL